MKRSSWLPKPRTPIKRSPVRKVNRKRKAENHARAYGDKAEWIRAQTCAVCGWPAPSEAAHIGSGGTSRKGDASTLLPMCGSRQKPHAILTSSGEIMSQMTYTTVEGCHAASHRGIKTFQKAHGNIDLKARAAEIEKLWRAHLSAHPSPSVHLSPADGT